jgi:hypothetical protein
MGTKLTFTFLLPALAIGVLALAVTQKRVGTLLPVAVAGALGFAAFGAYNYVLNFNEYGNPVASRRAFEVLRISAPWQRDQPANVLRYLEQMLDWPGLVTRDGSPVVRVQDAAFTGLARGLGRDVSVRELSASFLHARWMPDEELSGFSPTGFLIVLVSPLVLALALRDFRKSRDPARLVEACLVLLALGWSVPFLISAQPWTGQLRFFLVVLPLLAAAAIPRLTRGRGRAAVLIAASATALVVATNVTFSGAGGVRRGDFRRPDFEAGMLEEVMSWWKVHLPEMYPEGATLGIAPEFNDTVFHLFRSLPRFRFLPVAEEEIPAGIRTGRFVGALTGQFRNPLGQGVMRSGQPLPRSFLHPSQPGSFFREHPNQYRLHFGLETSAPVVEFAIPEGLAWDLPSLHLRIPTSLVKAAGSPAVLILTAERPLLAADHVVGSCGVPATPAETTQDGAEIRVVLSASEEPFVELWLARSGTGAPATFRRARIVRAGPPVDSLVRSNG